LVHILAKERSIEFHYKNLLHLSVQNPIAANNTFIQHSM
jgi:hypothetical protein